MEGISGPVGLFSSIFWNERFSISYERKNNKKNAITLPDLGWEIIVMEKGRNAVEVMR